MNIEEQKTTEQLIHEILLGSKESMKANLSEQLKKSLNDHISWSMRDYINKVTAEFVEKEMKDEIKDMLVSQKSVIMESLKDAFVKIGAQVAEAMIQTSMKNLSVDSYNMKEILKKIVG